MVLMCVWSWSWSLPCYIIGSSTNITEKCKITKQTLYNEIYTYFDYAGNTIELEAIMLGQRYRPSCMIKKVDDDISGPISCCMHACILDWLVLRSGHCFLCLVDFMHAVYYFLFFFLPSFYACLCVRVRVCVYVCMCVYGPGAWIK